LDFILNTHYREGQLSSLKEGLRNLPTGSTEALVWPVDQPLVKLETVRTVLAAFQIERKHLTIPVFDGKRGHPVVYDIAAIHAAFSLKKNQTAKELQQIFSKETTFVEVEDEGVVRDIDTPEDYQKYIKDAGL
jgi:molybdenum cofactor cytidylyltransferase